jgi:hypothetical protein
MIANTMAALLLTNSSLAAADVKYNPVPPLLTALLYSATALATLAGVVVLAKT